MKHLPLYTILLALLAIILLSSCTEQTKTVQFVVHLDLDTAYNYMLIASTDTELEAFYHNENTSADTIITDGSNKYYDFTIHNVGLDEIHWQVEAYEFSGDSIKFVLGEIGTFRNN